MAILVGSDGDDVLRGGPADDELSGLAGNDRLDGGPGADVLGGGDDDGYTTVPGRFFIWGDTAEYVRSDAGVTVNLAMGTAQGGHAEGDTLAGIESVRGSDHADILTARTGDPSAGSALWGNKGGDRLQGGTGSDMLWGGKGTDTLDGGGGDDVLEGGVGADWLDGGEGSDRAAYRLSDAGVAINLAAGTGQGGHAEGDTLLGIENLTGSRFNDHLTGDDRNNRLIGDAGNDTLEGGKGDDVLDGGAGADWLDGGDGNDRLNGQDGQDRLKGGAGNDKFAFGDGDTVMDFADGRDTIDLRQLVDITADNFAESVTIRANGDDAEVVIGEAVLTVSGVSPAELTADDFLLA